MALGKDAPALSSSVVYFGYYGMETGDAVKEPHNESPQILREVDHNYYLNCNDE